MSVPSQPQRVISALLVLLLHVLLLLAFLQFLVKPQGPRLPNPERLLEFVIRMTTNPPPAPAPASRRQQRVPARRLPSEDTAGPLPSLTAPIETPDIRGLGQALLGCAPENLSNLTAEQRSHCPGGISRPADGALMEPPSHVKDPLRRAAEMAAKNAPLRIPCTSVAKAAASGGS